LHDLCIHNVLRAQYQILIAYSQNSIVFLIRQ